MPAKKPAKKKQKNETMSLTELRDSARRAEAEANASRAEARRRLCAIARDLTGVAAGLARKGRPRLLAVLAKIASDSPRETMERKLREALAALPPRTIMLQHQVPRPARTQQQSSASEGSRPTGATT
jgi:hypothetical protein